MTDPRQMLDVVDQIIQRERALQRDVADRLFGPYDAILDLLEQSSTMLRQQADAMDAAGRALQETAAMMQAQSELFAQTIKALRQPVAAVKAAAGPPKKKRSR